jgi:K+ transporter
VISPEAGLRGCAELFLARILIVTDVAYETSFAIFTFLSKISSRARDYFKIPHDGVIEVGFRIEI